MSILLILTMSVSLWSPVGSGKVQAMEIKHSVAQMATSANGTDSNTTKSYEIVFQDEDGNEITPDTSLEAEETLQLRPCLVEVAAQEDSDTAVESIVVEDAAFTYASSDETVAVVSAEGVVTAKAIPTQKSANITVTATSEANANVTANVTLTVAVNAVAVDSVELSCEAQSLVINNSFSLAEQVTVLPTTALQDVTYSSSDNVVAEVSETGVVTAKAVGLATITVASKADATKKDTIVIRVLDIPVSLRLNQSAYSMKATDSFQLEVYAVYASGKEEKLSVTDAALTFQSMDETIVTVSDTGLVTALVQQSYPVSELVQVHYQFYYDKDGNAYNGDEMVELLTTTCIFTVTPIPVEQVVIENDVKTVTLKITEQYVLKTHVLPTNATNQTVSYKSSDKDVAKVDENGVITATGIGEATITAYSKENSSAVDTFVVKVYQTTFNVKELGADGTDKSNDSPEINKILKYATKIDEPITVVFPEGTYYIYSTLKVYAKTNIVLDDNTTVIRMKSASGKTMLVNRTDPDATEKKGEKGYTQCKDIVITGGTWDGNATGDADANCFYFGHAQNITITDTTIKNNSGAHLIEFAGVKNALVENVELQGYTACTNKEYLASGGIDADKEAIQMDVCSSSAPAMKPWDGTPCDTITIRNCTISNYMSGIGTHSALSGVYSKNIRIENNTFRNIANACVNLRNYKNVTIDGNTAKNCTTFMYASNSQGVVTNNKATMGTSYKPKTSKGLRAKNGITISNSSNFNVEKNTFEKAKSNGICVWNGSTAVIKNNKIKSNKLYGMRTQGSTITLKKNSFSKNKKGVYDTYKDATVKSSDDIRAYYIDIKPSYKYKGKAVKPKIKIKGLNKKYYKVTYKNNKRPGTATVIIKGKGKVKQTLKIKYKIKK